MNFAQYHVASVSVGVQRKPTNASSGLERMRQRHRGLTHTHSYRLAYINQLRHASTDFDPMHQSSQTHSYRSVGRMSRRLADERRQDRPGESVQQAGESVRLAGEYSTSKQAGESVQQACVVSAGLFFVSVGVRRLFACGFARAGHLAAFLAPFGGFAATKGARRDIPLNRVVESRGRWKAAPGVFSRAEAKVYIWPTRRCASGDGLETTLLRRRAPTRFLGTPW